MKTQTNKMEKELIEFFKKYRSQSYTQLELAEIFGISSRNIRKHISNINNDRSNNFIILTSGKGYYLPKRVTPKLIDLEYRKLRRAGINTLRRAASLGKKFNLPDEDIFAIIKESND